MNAIISVIVIGIVFSLLSAIVTGGMFMIVLGILHSYNAMFPALGFIESFLIVVLVQIAQIAPAKTELKMK